jgi:hypothetical protein
MSESGFRLPFVGKILPLIEVSLLVTRSIMMMDYIV